MEFSWAFAVSFREGTVLKLEQCLQFHVLGSFHQRFGIAVFLGQDEPESDGGPVCCVSFNTWLFDN